MTTADLLSDAGQRLKQARHDTADAMADIISAAAQAREEGMSMAEIARQAGVTRQTLYTLLPDRG